ncbi:hypothetical protein ES703_74784 [subsurface metagenome]
MKTKIKVNSKTGVFYMPKDLLADGFKGEMDALSNAMTFTIVHPEADLEGVKESLEIMLMDINLRLKSRATNG